MRPLRRGGRTKRLSSGKYPPVRTNCVTEAGRLRRRLKNFDESESEEETGTEEEVGIDEVGIEEEGLSWKAGKFQLLVPSCTSLR